STNAYATRDTVLIRFSDSVIRKYIMNNINIAFLIIESLSKNLIEHLEFTEDAISLNAYERVSKEVYKLFSRKNSRSINITQQKIAQLLALSREKTNFSLRRLTEVGAISLARARIQIINPILLKKQFSREGMN